MLRRWYYLTCPVNYLFTKRVGSLCSYCCNHAFQIQFIDLLNADGSNQTVQWRMQKKLVTRNACQLKAMCSWITINFYFIFFSTFVVVRLRLLWKQFTAICCVSCNMAWWFNCNLCVQRRFLWAYTWLAIYLSREDWRLCPKFKLSLVTMLRCFPLYTVVS